MLLLIWWSCGCGVVFPYARIVQTFAWPRVIPSRYRHCFEWPPEFKWRFWFVTAPAEGFPKNCCQIQITSSTLHLLHSLHHLHQLHLHHIHHLHLLHLELYPLLHLQLCPLHHLHHLNQLHLHHQHHLHISI